MEVIVRKENAKSKASSILGQISNALEEKWSSVGGKGSRRCAEFLLNRVFFAENDSWPTQFFELNILVRSEILKNCTKSNGGVT